MVLVKQDIIKLLQVNLGAIHSVNGRNYSRRINPRIRFKECERRPELCSKKYFLVLYSNKDWTKSLFNYENEIKNPKGLSPIFKLTYSNLNKNLDTTYLLNAKVLPQGISLKELE